jgi:hypothetical protein
MTEKLSKRGENRPKRGGKRPNSGPKVNIPNRLITLAVALKRHVGIRQAKFLLSESAAEYLIGREATRTLRDWRVSKSAAKYLAALEREFAKSRKKAGRKP